MGMEMPDQIFQEEMSNIDSWLAELRLLSVSSKSKSNPKESKELQVLANNAKET
jgi:hypothetical protein